MIDWGTVSSIATAGGTLVLAIATFSSVRSANRAARTAERALQAGLRPVLMQGRADDPPERVLWVDGFGADVGGGQAAVAVTDEAIYLAMPLRNVGQGIAVLHSWYPLAVWHNAAGPHAEIEDFRRLTRDLYVPAGDVGFWQGAIRDPAEPIYAPLADVIRRRERFIIDVLYGDHEGGQRTITRFGLNPEDDGGWRCSAGRHWNLDRDDPR